MKDKPTFIAEGPACEWPYPGGLRPDPWEASYTYESVWQARADCMSAQLKGYGKDENDTGNPE